MNQSSHSENWKHCCFGRLCPLHWDCESGRCIQVNRCRLEPLQLKGSWRWHLSQGPGKTASTWTWSVDYQRHCEHVFSSWLIPPSLGRDIGTAHLTINCDWWKNQVKSDVVMWQLHSGRCMPDDEDSFGYFAQINSSLIELKMKIFLTASVLILIPSSTRALNEALICDHHTGCQYPDR